MLNDMTKTTESRRSTSPLLARMRYSYSAAIKKAYLQIHFLKQYHPGEFLASFSVKAAGGSGGEVFRQEFFSVEADSAFLSKEAGYPYGPACFDGAEGRG